MVNQRVILLLIMFVCTAINTYLIFMGNTKIISTILALIGIVGIGFDLFSKEVK